MPADGAVTLSVAAGVDWTALGYALGLLALAVVLIALEFFIVSFGVLAFTAIACAVGAVYFAFVASDVAGWAMLVAAPMLAVVLTRWGLRRVRESAMVPHAEITAEAGYHHAAERVGAAPGALGVMTTTAMPSGRARFDEGECDVRSQSGSLERGTLVRVVRMDGPTVSVVRVDDAPTADE